MRTTTKARRTKPAPPREPVSLPLGPAYTKTTANLANPPFWPTGHRTMTFENKIAALALLAPDRFQGLHMLVDAVLRESWWEAARSDEGLQLLARITTGDDEA